MSYQKMERPFPNPKKKEDKISLPVENHLIKGWKILRVLFYNGPMGITDLTKNSLIKASKSTVKRKVETLEKEGMIETRYKSSGIAQIRECELTENGRETLLFFQRTKLKPIIQIIDELRKKWGREPYIEEIAFERGLEPQDHAFLKNLWKIAKYKNYKPEQIPPEVSPGLIQISSQEEKKIKMKGSKFPHVDS